MTTDQGIPVADNQNSLRQGPRGPTLLEDFILREKIQHFDHERIPERIVHALNAQTRLGYAPLDAMQCAYAVKLLRRTHRAIEEGEPVPVRLRVPW